MRQRTASPSSLTNLGNERRFFSHTITFSGPNYDPYRLRSERNRRSKQSQRVSSFPFDLALIYQENSKRIATLPMDTASVFLRLARCSRVIKKNGMHLFYGMGTISKYVSKTIRKQIPVQLLMYVRKYAPRV